MQELEQNYLKLFTDNYTMDELYEFIISEYVFRENFCNLNKIKSDILSLETNRYREFVNALMNNNIDLVSIIENERIQYIKAQIELIDENNIFKYLYDYKVDELKLILPKNSIKN